jgi:uncharacterized protein (TIGR00369 family)
MNNPRHRKSIMDKELPAGFKPLVLAGVEFLSVSGPLYGKWIGRNFYMGFSVKKRHCNSAGVCHGGMLMTFADMLMGIGSRLQLENDPGRIPTIHLSGDFLSPAPQGTWVEGCAEVLRFSRNLLFAQCLLSADGNPILRASGVFKRIEFNKNESNSDEIPLEGLVGSSLMRRR